MEWANIMFQTMGEGYCSSGMEQKKLKESFELRTSCCQVRKKKHTRQQTNIEICAQISILVCWLLCICEGEGWLRMTSGYVIHGAIQWKECKSHGGCQWVEQKRLNKFFIKPPSKRMTGELGMGWDIPVGGVGKQNGSTMGEGYCSSGMEQKKLKESFELRTSCHQVRKKNKNQQINIEICAQISILICLLLFVCEGKDGCGMSQRLFSKFTNQPAPSLHH
jgi:hypothetical protein